MKRISWPIGLVVAGLALTVFLLLTSCSEDSPTPRAVDAATAVVSDAVVATQAVEESPVPASPTALSLPTAEFGGVRLTYDDNLLGPLAGSGSYPAQAPSTDQLALPARIAFEFKGSEELEAGELTVISVADYKKITELAPAHISNLKEILAEKPVQPGSPLLLFPTTGIAEQFLTEPDYVTFEDGSGIAFVTAPGDEEMGQPLYVFQGLTQDESYYVTLLLPILAASPDDLAGGDEVAATEREGDLAPVVDTGDTGRAMVSSTQNALSDMLASLAIRPTEALLPATPSAYLAYSGVLLGYEPNLSGTAVPAKEPPIYFGADGKAVFMAGVPDAIEVAFGRDEEEKNEPALVIQRVKGRTGQFYQSVPVELQQKVMALENQIAGKNVEEDEALGDKNFERTLQFSGGLGRRWVQELSLPDGTAAAETRYVYEYEGVTDDGQYFVRLSHPLQFSGVIDDTLLNSGSQESGSFFTQLAQLDDMMQSLVIAPEASTESSIPENEADCLNEAQFVDDVTIKEQAIVEGGRAFTKVWRVRNTGTCVWTPAYGLSFAGGNPLEWSNAGLLDLVPPGEETEISTVVISPEAPGLYEAWWQLADQQGEPFGPNYRVLFESPRPATDVPGYGVIRGDLGYPASGMPAMTIYFLRTDNSQRFALETEEGWVHYANELPTGDYYVFARVSGDESDSGGGFTKAVLCGMTCDDHQLVPVTVAEGKATEDVDILDWYAPAGTFPLP